MRPLPWRSFVLLMLLCPTGAQGQERPSPIPAAQRAPSIADSLPIKRVVLYKNGVGYFEHLGSVRGNQDVTISFTSGQLNDVLKSLTVLDLNGGRITGVGYGSASPVDRQLGDLRLPVNEKSSLSEFLGALRGARLEVRSGPNVITGRLLSIERKTRTGGGTTLEVDYLALITDTGEVKTTELTPAFSVRLLERGLPGKVDRYLDLIAAGRETDVRRMVISTEGSGERSMFVSYISEVPVWKATYRIVLNPKTGKLPLLQGWAIVDNTVGEDWENVQLSLVAGAPQSFIQNLSQPYYSRRPVVALPVSVTMNPQTFEATLLPGGAVLSGTVTDASGASVPNATVRVYDLGGTLVAEANANTRGYYEFGSLPAGPVRVQINSPGFMTTQITGILASRENPTRRDATLQVGNVSESVTVNAEATTLQTQSSSLSGGARNAGNGSNLGGSGLPLSARNYTGLKPRPGTSTPPPDPSAIDNARASLESAAVAQALGDLFEYKLKEPVTIAKNRSALVPIVQSAINAEKVSVWNERAGLTRPQRALWLTNTSGLTLDGGSFSILEEDTFAGEGIFEPIRPEEKRLISYATDLAVNASSRNQTEQQRITKVAVSHGIMTHISETREKKTYTFRNEDSTARTIVVEHPVRPGYEIRSEAKPAETTAGWMRFRVPVEPKQTASLVIEEARPMQATYALSNLTADQVSFFVSQKTISAPMESAFRKILAQKQAMEDLDTQKQASEDETTKIFDDQQRLRENMKALKGSTDEKILLLRYTRQLNDQEDRLEALRKDSQRLESQRDAAEVTLDKMIQELAFDVTL
jgi:hypothetical protein